MGDLDLEPLRSEVDPRGCEFYVAIRSDDPYVVRDNALSMLLGQNMWPGQVGVFVSSNDEMHTFAKIFDDHQFEYTSFWVETKEDGSKVEMQETNLVKFTPRNGHNFASSRVSVVHYEPDDLWTNDTWLKKNKQRNISGI